MPTEVSSQGSGRGEDGFHIESERAKSTTEAASSSSEEAVHAMGSIMKNIGGAIAGLLGGLMNCGG